MQHRLKISQKTMEILKDLQSRTNLTPNILARLAIGLSLKDETPLPADTNDTMGLEFNRHTLTGELEILYKALMKQHAKKNLSDEEFFPTYVRLHMERGVQLLMDEYNYAGNYEKFI